MPISFLSLESLDFPPVTKADRDGLLAVGGDFSEERLLLAYRSGMFPWFIANGWIHWFAPPFRMVLPPANIQVSKSMEQVLRNKHFEIKFDSDFLAVIQSCAQTSRKHEDSTWISNEFITAYTHLHSIGYAHSVEAWQDGELVGGLYGISIGKMFFGESMFSKKSNSSKAAFITLNRKLAEKEFHLIDCQVYTEHLASFGAYMITRKQFMDILKISIEAPTILGNWGKILE